MHVYLLPAVYVDYWCLPYCIARFFRGIFFFGALSCIMDIILVSDLDPRHTNQYGFAFYFHGQRTTANAVAV